MGYPSYDLTFNRLRTNNLQRCRKWHSGGVNDWSLSDWFMAVTGELGEAANLGKKLKRLADGLVGNKEGENEVYLIERLADELADVVIYLDLLAASEGIDLSEAVVEKFNKTSEKNGFSERLF